MGHLQPSKEAIKLFQWLATLQDPARQPTIDLFQLHPFMSHPLGGTAYGPLQMLLCKDPDQKIRVIYPNNAAVDDFPAKFVSVCQKMGFRDEEIATPLSAYAFPSETEAGLDAGLSEQDPFLSTFVIQSTIKDSSGKRPARKNSDKASMHVAYLRNFDKGRRVSDLRMRKAKTEMKLLADNLAKQRIVCATASAARETKVRESFKPTAVFQDENGRARDMMMMFASFPTSKLYMLFWRPEDLMEISLAAAAQNKNSSYLSGLTSIQHNNHADNHAGHQGGEWGSAPSGTGTTDDSVKW
ncbi:putative CCHC-type domain-containing protein [Seiridium unicorne]|uniref:CCHC-type domain-containing protein n=1 Tax=Seiridium unicorne TaxID=138068 RepID=A0ABR2UDV5_9PEZI